MILRNIAIAALAGVLLQASSAQDVQNIQDKIGARGNPPGLSFELRTKNGLRKPFRLGEMIEIEEDYSSSLPGRYSLLQNPKKLEGGSFVALEILPAKGVIDRVHQTGWVSAAAILHARCAGEGIGGAVGGGCGDCDGVYKLGIEPIRFPYVLNYRFAIAVPGRYTVQARGANVVAATDVSKPILITSNKLEIEIVRDDTWADDQLQMAVRRYEEAQRRYLQNGWDKKNPATAQVPQQWETAQEMVNASEIIRFLDTEESLREAVRLYDGSPRIVTYENSFLKAILESSHRDLAVRLLKKRMVEGDFLASEDLIDLLTAMTIQVEEPVVFGREDLPSLRQLNPRTLEILREDVLALGESLPAKHGEARELGTATFEKYASRDYCAVGPLIEKGEAQQILLKARPN